MAATPLKRLCTREDIAGIINFLASDAASFINTIADRCPGAYNVRVMIREKNS